MSADSSVQIPPRILQRCWFLAGPTASGKTAAGIVLAEQIGAEIVSLDSMALYRGMDIGTAKPSPAEQARVPHHLVDMLDPDEEFSVAQYVALAADMCEDIIGRGSIPLFVGGTGLYLRGILRGVFQGPPADWNIRRRLETELSSIDLHARLRDVDPKCAAKLHPNDTRRVIRALEVYELTGRPLSEQQEQPPLPPGERPEHVYWISPPRDWLYDRINRRVDAMIEAGLVDEVRTLLACDKPLSHTARQALGYKEVIDWLELRCDENAMIDTIKTRTRQFAKRQHTWFRNLEECKPITIEGHESPDQLADAILE